MHSKKDGRRGHFNIIIGEQERGIELIKNQCISRKLGGGDNLSRSYRNKEEGSQVINNQCIPRKMGGGDISGLL